MTDRSNPHGPADRTLTEVDSGELDSVVERPAPLSVTSTSEKNCESDGSSCAAAGKTASTTKSAAAARRASGRGVMGEGLLGCSGIERFRGGSISDGWGA